MRKGLAEPLRFVTNSRELNAPGGRAWRLSRRASPTRSHAGARDHASRHRDQIHELIRPRGITDIIEGVAEQWVDRERAEGGQRRPSREAAHAIHNASKRRSASATWSRNAKGRFESIRHDEQPWPSLRQPTGPAPRRPEIAAAIFALVALCVRGPRACRVCGRGSGVRALITLQVTFTRKPGPVRHAWVANRLPVRWTNGSPAGFELQPQLRYVHQLKPRGYVCCCAL